MCVSWYQVLRCLCVCVCILLYSSDFQRISIFTCFSQILVCIMNALTFANLSVLVFTFENVGILRIRLTVF